MWYISPHSQLKHPEMFGATADAAFELEWLLHLTSYNFNFYPFSFNGVSKNTADTLIWTIIKQSLSQYLSFKARTSFTTSTNGSLTISRPNL